MKKAITVNCETHSVELDPRQSLLDFLRDDLGLTAAKKGCNHGQCGCCSVLVGERRVLSCLTLLALVDAPVTTLEGIGTPEDLHPMQSAFFAHNAFQCGYCTPGQIMSAIGCVREGNATSPAAVRDAMAGNLCRCAAYPRIVDAVLDGAQQMQKDQSK